MFALITKIAHAVIPHHGKPAKEPKLPTQPINPQPTCMGEYHDWRWKIDI